MTNAKSKGLPASPTAGPDPKEDPQEHPTRLAGRVSGVIRAVRSSATTLMDRLPATVKATRARAHSTATALQSLPNSTLRGLAATSLGLGAGFYIAGAPRVVTAAGVAPALVMGAAMVLRPNEPDASA